MGKVPTLVLTLLVTLCAAAQDQTPENPNNMPDMDVSHPPSMREMPGMGDGNASAMHAMEGHHMDMGPHMKMTPLRPLHPGDEQRAEEVVVAARAVAERYRDYKVALADGYQIFLPSVPQKMYHFTNYQSAFYARKNFDASRPTSLLYEKHGEDYQLIGVMYTARKDSTEEELNARIPLSIAQWHAHVNLCLPQHSQRDDVISPVTSSASTGRLRAKPNVMRRAEDSFRKFSDGWSTYTLSRRSRKTSGPWSASAITWTESCPKPIPSSLSRRPQPERSY